MKKKDLEAFLLSIKDTLPIKQSNRLKIINSTNIIKTPNKKKIINLPLSTKTEHSIKNTNSSIFKIQKTQLLAHPNSKEYASSENGQFSV